MSKTALPVTEAEYLRPLELRKTDLLHVTLKGKTTDTFHLQLTNPVSGFPSGAAREDFPARFPERTEIKGQYGTQWLVPATDNTALVISSLWPDTQVSMSDDAGIVYGYLLATLAGQQGSVRLNAEYHSYASHRDAVKSFTAPCPQFVGDFALRNGHRPMLHQRVGYACALRSEGYGLFMEQGTGKTMVVIGRVDTEAEQMKASEGRPLRVLIVAPKNVRVNWQREFEKFSRVKGKVTVLRGGAVERIKLLLEGLCATNGEQYTVIVCSYECLSNSWDMLGEIDWDLSVLDEAHFIKWPRTKRAQYAFKLRDVSRQRMALTGTPVCNTPIDLYSLFEFLHKGGSGFHSFDAFRSFYGVFKAVDAERGIKRLVGVQNLPFMRERLARMAIVVRKDEAMPDLPDKAYDVCEVEMTSEQQALYVAVATQLVAEIKRDMADEGRTINANHVLTRLLRLAQITSGFVTIDPIMDPDTGDVLSAKEIEVIDPNPKIEQLVELLKDKDATQKTIVWAGFVQDIKTIVARLEVEGIDCVEFYGATSEADRLEAERRFNYDPNCKVLVGNPASGGTGLNLIGYPPGDETYETNCDHVIYFSQGWSSPIRSQSEDRAHRRGTRQNVRITDLCVPNTIDEEIRARVTNKRVLALEVQDLREILGRVLGGAM